MKKHNYSVHEGRKEDHIVCDFCGNSFVESGGLKVHILRMHQECKNYKCDSCGKSFPRTTDLNQHIKVVHERIRSQEDHICDFCGSVMNQASTLRRHIKKFHLENIIIKH